MVRRKACQSAKSRAKPPEFSAYPMSIRESTFDPKLIEDNFLSSLETDYIEKSVPNSITGTSHGVPNILVYDDFLSANLSRTFRK